VETVLLPNRESPSLDAAIEVACRLLREGSVVGVPSETVYGLAGDALNPDAAAKIFESKQRPFFDPLICHLPEIEWLHRLATLDGRRRDLVDRLARRFWPGPLTMVVPRSSLVPELVCSGLPTVALRMSAHPVFQLVLKRFGGPLAAPSANRFGRISPTNAGHVFAELAGRIPMILDGGPTLHGLESTIVAVEEEGIRILRSGPVVAEDLAGEAVILSARPLDAGHSRVEAPGQLLSHYAPQTVLILGRPGDYSAEQRAGRGLLAWGTPATGFSAVESLSESMDLREAAARLFGCMRRLDESGVSEIVAELVPETGLGVAINDRLRRAAARGH
jgi:L-threonylcarbamoyladenylate synthase